MLLLLYGPCMIDEIRVCLDTAYFTEIEKLLLKVL